MGGLPLVSLEADAYLSIGNKNGAFNQHAVGSQQGYLLIQAHVGKLIFQLHALVKQSTGIKKLLGRQSAPFNPDIFSSAVSVPLFIVSFSHVFVNKKDCQHDGTGSPSSFIIFRS